MKTISAIEQQGAVSVQQQLEQKMTEARQICTEWGWTGEKCIWAWDRVENLQPTSSSPTNEVHLKFGSSHDEMKK